ncbi:MAG: RNA-binding protein [Deltaproteobacteria bacterium]|nr:RNA-binding protein [Deltaproteobacteria bacterium]MCL5791480.1 RNA-binding protein [Deltaproteobacteria bacterium]
MTKKLYVGNISFKATEDAVKTLFTTVGPVESVKIITDPQTGKSRGFGFVEMSTDEDANKAISSLNGSTLLERTISVALAKPKSDSRDNFGGHQRKERRERNY